MLVNSSHKYMLLSELIFRQIYPAYIESEIINTGIVQPVVPLSVIKDNV